MNKAHEKYVYCLHYVPKYTKEAFAEMAKASFVQEYGRSLSCVKFDDLLLLEELGEVLSLRQGDNLAAHILNVRFHVSRNRGALVVIVSSDASARLSVSNLD